jgi:hypothetical protein
VLVIVEPSWIDKLQTKYVQNYDKISDGVVIKEFSFETGSMDSLKETSDGTILVVYEASRYHATCSFNELELKRDAFKDSVPQ